MTDYKKYFKNKKITVMGLGLLGRGVGDAQFLADCGAELIVTDLKSEDELADSVNTLQRYDNVTFVLGEHRTEDFENRDMILVAAGVPYDSPYLTQARENEIRLVQSAALFAELAQIPIIGVTGTRGKSTVTHMIHHTLTHATGEHIILGGNIRGVSNLALLNDVHEDSLAVMELDSWQLQGFDWAGISPQIAVFTNFMDDHRNYYQRDGMTEEEAVEQYFADKANIFRYQEETGVFITTPDVFERAKTFATGKNITLGQEVVLADASVLPEDCLLATPGEHNRKNAALAYEALKATSLADDAIFEGLASFPGVPGRLEYLGTVPASEESAQGIKIYNDNNATTPQATVAGIEALAEGKNIVLITGGTDKGLELGTLPDKIESHVSHLVLYSGTGTEKLKKHLSHEISHEEHDTLAACVHAAASHANAGDVILFSPAFASFGHEFKNEYDRNDKFVAAVDELKNDY